MSDPLVTILTPAYNRASYLEDVIKSVIYQDYPNIEYIVLDDGSTDNTRDVLAKYSGKLTWESQPNLGETRTVNKAFGMAHGEIICVVNSDDPILPGAISTAVEFMKARPGILMAYPDWNYINANSDFVWHVQVPEYDYFYMVTRHRCFVGPGAFLRRRALELIGGRDPSFNYVADFDFYLRLGLHGDFARIPKTLANFRIHASSASLAMRGIEMANEDIRMIEKLYSQPNLPEKIRRARSRSFSAAHLHASRVCGAARRESLRHFLLFIYFYPPNLFTESGIFIQRATNWLMRRLTRLTEAKLG